MTEESYLPEHSTWQDKDATTPYSLPYIDTYQPIPSPPLPTSSAQKPEQQKIAKSEIDQLLDHYKLGGIQRELKYDVSSKMTNENHLFLYWASFASFPSFSLSSIWGTSGGYSGPHF